MSNGTKSCLMFCWHFITSGNIRDSLRRNGLQEKQNHPHQLQSQKKHTSLQSRSPKWQMIKFQQLKRSKTLWAFNEWNMPWERDLLSINLNPGSLIKPSIHSVWICRHQTSTFLIIFNSRHIFPFNWHSEMPVQSYQIGTKFSKEVNYTLLNSESSD